jgi:PAT family beta-lactamase induction signal transducer AmpG
VTTSSPAYSPARAWLRALSVYADRRILTVLFLGFSSGLPLLLTAGTLNAWLTEAGVSRTAIGLFAAVSIPYAFKFAWAPLIDRLTLPVLTRRLGRRRGWALFTQVCLAGALVFLSTTDPATDLWWTAMAAVCVAFCAASQDIVIDAYRIEVLAQDQQGAGAAAVTAGYRLGIIAAGAGGLALASLVESLGVPKDQVWPTVYLGMAGLVGVGMVTVLLSREPEAAASPEGARLLAEADAWLAKRPGLGRRQRELAAWVYGAVIAPFRQFMTRGHWPLILLFIATYKLGDAYLNQMAMTFYLQTGFTRTQVAGITQLFGMLCSIGGVIAGGLFVARYGILRALMVCGVLQMSTNLVYALLAESGADLRLLTIAIGMDNFSGGMGTAALVAYLSSLCDAAYTATQYALLSSFISVGRDFLAAGSGWLADTLGWTGFFLSSMALALPALLLLVWLARIERRAGGPPAGQGTGQGQAQ